MTNGDRIRQMSNEELAKFINYTSSCRVCAIGDTEKCNAMCITNITAYLDMEVEE